MLERELFGELINHFIDEYGIEVEVPEDDSVMVFYKNGKELGSMDTDKRSLLDNISELSRILKTEIR